MLDFFPEFNRPKEKSSIEKAMAFVSIVISAAFAILILSVSIWILSAVF